jgi:hypothetical protein
VVPKISGFSPGGKNGMLSGFAEYFTFGKYYRDLECGSIFLCKEKVILQVGMSPILDFLI